MKDQDGRINTQHKIHFLVWFRRRFAFATVNEPPSQSPGEDRVVEEAPLAVSHCLTVFVVLDVGKQNCLPSIISIDQTFNRLSTSTKNCAQFHMTEKLLIPFVGLT